MHGRVTFPITAIFVGLAIFGGFAIFVAVAEYRGESAATAGIGWFAFWITMAVIGMLDRIEGYLSSIDDQLRAAAPRPAAAQPQTPPAAVPSPANVSPQHHGVHVRESEAKPTQPKASVVVPEMPADFRQKQKRAAPDFSAIDEVATSKKRRDP